MYDKKNYFSTNKSETQIENNNLQSFYESILKQKDMIKTCWTKKNKTPQGKKGEINFLCITRGPAVEQLIWFVAMTFTFSSFHLCTILFFF